MDFMRTILVSFYPARVNDQSAATPHNIFGFVLSPQLDHNSEHARLERFRVLRAQASMNSSQLRHRYW